MTRMEEVKRGIARAWDNVADGWRELTSRAGQALTRFNPAHRDDTLETHEERHLAASSRWGILAAEVATDDDAVEVTLEVPGMNADDFNIDVVGGDMLVVSGEKRLERSAKRGRYHVMERAYGRFERAIPLPVAVDEEGAKAHYDRGILKLTLPRAAHAKARRIKVNAA